MRVQTIRTHMAFLLSLLLLFQSVPILAANPPTVAAQSEADPTIYDPIDVEDIPWYSCSGKPWYKCVWVYAVVVLVGGGAAVAGGSKGEGEPASPTDSGNGGGSGSITIIGPSLP